MANTAAPASALTESRAASLVRAGLVVLLALLVASLLAAAGREAATALGLVTAGTVEARAVRAVFQFVGFGLAAAVSLALADDWDVLHVHRPVARDLLWAGAGLGALLVAGSLMSAAISAAGGAAAESQVIRTGTRAPRYFLYMIPVTLLLVGPAEELLFRGVVQGRLRAAWGTGPAIVVAGLLFGAPHLPGLIGGGLAVYVTLAVTAVLGMVLGYVYERSGTLLAPAVAHGLFNAVQFGLRYAGETGLL